MEIIFANGLSLCISWLYYIVPFGGANLYWKSIHFTLGDFTPSKTHVTSLSRRKSHMTVAKALALHTAEPGLIFCTT